MKNKLLTGLAAGVFVFGMVETAKANLIVNGSFELGNYNDPQGFQRLIAGDTSLEGWLIGGVGVDWHVGTANPSQNPALVGPHFESAQDGSLVIDLNLDGGSTGAGTISQTFATNPGTTYYASFYMAGVEWFGPLREVQVAVDGVSRIFSQTTSPQRALVWGLKSFDWTATGPQATLTFSSPDPSSFWGPLIDNVSVIVAAPVPEPATLLLLGTGIMGLAASRIRRKKK